jgi:hypothetical protein
MSWLDVSGVGMVGEISSNLTSGPFKFSQHFDMYLEP